MVTTTANSRLDSDLGGGRRMGNKIGCDKEYISDRLSVKDAPVTVTPRLLYLSEILHLKLT